MIKLVCWQTRCFSPQPFKGESVATLPPGYLKEEHPYFGRIPERLVSSLM